MIGAVLWAAAVLCGVTPTPAEFEERDSWVDAKFRGSPRELLAEPGLAILANYDPVQRNVHMGKPLKLQDKPFARGLFCHAPSMILVRIPSGGREFSAMVGVDTNDPAGEGSVVFSVHAGGNIVFRSDILRKGMAAVPVLVDLQGATEFTLEISDAGDGNACDQSCWAEAKIALADGKELWLDEMTMTDGGERPYDTEPFLSFVYDGRPSSEFLSDWTLERNSRELDPDRTEHSVTYRDPVTNLVVRCVGVAWKNYPTVEWTAYFKNEGTGDTPILESIQAIDTTFERSSQGEFLLHHHTGDRCTIDSFEPHSTTLGPNVSLTFAPRGGRPTNFEWPYYNLECPQQNEGVIIVIAWPGQWASRFVRDSGRALRVVGGQELTRLRLHPGEEIRTPLIVLQFYKGDWLRAQNVWRRWMFEHNFPKDHGKALSPKHGAASVWYFGFQCTQAGDIEFIHRFAEKGIQLNYWWMDAGWYPGGSWPVTGTWEADKSRFPNGLRAVTDATREYGAETIVWFEVERVHPGTWLAVNRPEWVFGGADGGLLKMNEPEAVQWLTNHIDKLISDEGIDLYRSDFNIDPLDFWRGNDAADRQGITEIRYIEGYQAYWDELRRRHPGMLIDSCASGGRRDDLETMRRAVPLLRSDLENNPEAYQCHNYGFGLWLPYFDSANYEKFDPYYFRSTIAPFLQCNWDVRKDDFDVKGATERIKEWRSVAGYYFGDFWPLSDYSTADNVWMAWQLDRPDLAAGMVQAFRRAKCPYVSAQYKLRALEPDAPYLVKNIDSTESMEVSGQSLMENGLLITIGQQPDAVIVTYEKAGK